MTDEALLVTAPQQSNTVQPMKDVIRRMVASFIFVFFLCVAIIFTGGGDRETRDERAARISKSQSEGVEGVTILVKRAYNYTGHSYHENKPDRKLVAVDVEFKKPNAGLDLDDVEIINGATGESLGSFPDIYLLTTKGEVVDQSEWSTGRPKVLRILLIYQVSTKLKSIKLRYWGEELTHQSVLISGTGPTFTKGPE